MLYWIFIGIFLVEWLIYEIKDPDGRLYKYTRRGHR